MTQLDGLVALVTGGARGLGWAAANALARAGAEVILSSRSAAVVDEAVQRLRETGAAAHGVVLDVTVPESIEAAVADAVRLGGGRLDVLVNNAGGGSGQSPAWLPDRAVSDIEESLRVNLLGPILVCREAAPIMMAQRSGSIISIASVAGHVGRDRRIYDANGMLGQPIDYAAAKAGISGMTRDLAAMLGPYGVRANAISPGGFAAEGHPTGFVSDYARLTALGRMGHDGGGSGSDLDGAIVFLAGSASAYVTGQDIVVDGGFTLTR
ncbi:SDR family NAD(P)-dependent oxidoreductase [Pseudactinotalea sp.]|uniref:SDR family NAD(P)-dependent oxidoreductase n=1 Tax=Pseudactinotalea sp. TaxID=1926260 RepID=UPI003B3B966A